MQQKIIEQKKPKKIIEQNPDEKVIALTSFLIFMITYSKESS